MAFIVLNVFRPAMSKSWKPGQEGGLSIGQGKSRAGIYHEEKYKLPDTETLSQ